MEDTHCKPNPWVSLRRDQLIPVNKAVNKKEQLEKGLEEEEKKNIVALCCLMQRDTHSIDSNLVARHRATRRDTQCK
jgi:hypothetical protein